MARKHYNLPPLTTLAAFEAAARLGSFKHASEELNVTPSAVSHQIKALERETGITVFLRRHRGVELTADGEALFSVLARGFGDVSDMLRRLRANRQDAIVTIGSTTAVSSLWLTPRIGEFWREHPTIAINQHVSDHPLSRTFGLDLQIRYGGEELVHQGGVKLFDDILLPVCSPDYARKWRQSHPELSGNPEDPHDLEQLANSHLIHMLAEDMNWTTWRTWFAMLGYHGDIRHSHSVNNYTIALQVARDNGGVVLGWRKLVQPLLERGVLVALTDREAAAPQSFYVLGDSEPAEQTRIVRDWLIASV